MINIKWVTHPANQIWWTLAAGFSILYVPTIVNLMGSIWFSDEQGHGPIVLAICIWLIYQKWEALADESSAEPKPRLAWVLMGFALLLYIFGRSQRILAAQVSSAIIVVPALILLMRGTRPLRVLWFPLFFMVFLIPLPATLVDMVTQPLKLAVSTVAAAILYEFGYPIARSGVILEVGKYQLLVADACAGLHTLFTLEAMGLLYLNVVQHSSLLRNVVLAILIVPISFVANVFRVLVLSLITYHFGDAAGQGFLHGFAGMVLFLSALLLIITADSLLRVAAAPKLEAAP